MSVESTKQRQRQLLWSALFLVILALLLYATTILLQPSAGGAGGNPWKGYLRQPTGSIDVLHIGNSHMYCTWQPTTAWQEAGITSWNIGAGSISAENCLLWLKTALRTQKPQVVAIEISAFFSETPANPQFKADELAMMQMPLSPETIQMVTPKLEPNLWGGGAFLIPTLRYSKNYKDFSRESVQNFWHSREKEWAGGAELIVSRELATTSKQTETQADVSEDMQAFRANAHTLSTMIELCQAQNAKVLLWEAPLPSLVQTQKLCQVKDFTARIDTNDSVTVFSFAELSGEPFDATDWGDEEHLNVWGAEKATVQLLAQITPLLSGVSHSESATNQWDTYTQKTTATIKQRAASISH